MTDRRNELLALHRRVLADDPSASAELFSAIHRPLVSVLMRAHGRSGLNVEQTGDLATDAILEYLRQPLKFDPERASLFSYLAIIAKGDAINFLQARHRERKGLRQAVELSASERNIVEAGLDSEIDAARILSQFGSQIVDDQIDEVVLRLMLAGEKDTDAYAAVMGLDGADQDAKKALVKQRRDKLEKRLRRLGEEL